MGSRFLCGLGAGMVFLIAGSSCYAVSLDDMTGTMVPRHRLQYQIDGGAFGMHEQGIHGSASFGGFNATPWVATLGNQLTFSPSDSAELRIGVQDDIPTHYRRNTRNNADVVTSMQWYDLVRNDALSIGGRLRRGFNEFAFHGFGRRQYSTWNFATSVQAAPIYFNYIDSSYEDLRLKWGWLSASAPSESPAGLSSVDRPLLAKGQVWVDSELRLRNGRLTRNGVFYLSNQQNVHFLFRTMPHLDPRTAWYYGLSENTEIMGGLGVKTPFSYKYVNELYKAAPPTSQIIQGTYDYNAWVEVPLSARWRVDPVTELDLDLDLTYVSQRLEYSQKQENGILLIYDEKKLHYYNLKPSMAVSHMGGKDSRAREFLGRRMLSRGAWLFELKWMADYSILDKNETNGTQNLADPYSVYQYPVDFFRAASEYAAFLSGNNATTPADVAPQNYQEIRLRSSYGLADHWDMALGVGYRSQASAHQFSLSDLGNRAFIFRPFTYVEGQTQLRVGKSILLAFSAHYVPSYKTEMLSSVHPEQFKDKTSYIDLNVQARILF